jgi:hypothetical protein
VPALHARVSARATARGRCFLAPVELERKLELRRVVLPSAQLDGRATAPGAVVDCGVPSARQNFASRPLRVIWAVVSGRSCNKSVVLIFALWFLPVARYLRGSWNPGLPLAWPVGPAGRASCAASFPPLRPRVSVASAAGCASCCAGRRAVPAAVSCRGFSSPWLWPRGCLGQCSARAGSWGWAWGRLLIPPTPLHLSEARVGTIPHNCHTGELEYKAYLLQKIGATPKARPAKRECKAECLTPTQLET